MAHFTGREARAAKKAKDEQLLLRRGASRVAREIRAFWGKLNKVGIGGQASPEPFALETRQRFGIEIMPSSRAAWAHGIMESLPSWSWFSRAAFGMGRTGVVAAVVVTLIKNKNKNKNMHI